MGDVSGIRGAGGAEGPKEPTGIGATYNIDLPKTLSKGSVTDPEALMHTIAEKNGFTPEQFAKVGAASLCQPEMK